MAFKTTLTTKGGGKLQAVLKKAEEARRKQVKVGFFSTAKYEDQTPVATVAAVQEFGAPKASIPERPFFRQAIAELEQDLPKELAKVLDPQTMTVDDATANRIGSYAVQVVQDRIIDLVAPPNAETTVKRGDNPLVDSKQLHDAVDYQTE